MRAWRVGADRDEGWRVLRLARDGLREVVSISLLTAAATAVALWLFWPAAILTLGLWCFGVAFFRDPHREAPRGPGLIVAPADGKVTEVVNLPGGRARIGIFLSIFDPHVNRSPCAGRVADVTYRPGRFRNAMSRASSELNESNTVMLTDVDGVERPVVVKQIAGAIARRIVCRCRVGDRLERGERMGMIKFGSRTELYLPLTSGTELVVRPGDRVKAGLTVVARLRDQNGAS